MPGAHQALTDFVALADGSAVTSVSTYEGVRRTGMHMSFTGPSSDLLRKGWRPAPDCTSPTYLSGIYG